MSVDTWDPASQVTELDASTITELLSAAEHLDLHDFGLPAATLNRLAATARLGPKAWQAAEGLSDAELAGLVRLYTLAESRFPSWRAGAESSVIALSAMLRSRGTWPADLSAWIRLNSDNQFLPYGSLADRL